ncbi:hypothetical protein TST_0600 [Thermosulfidibacter takaii ABI70S6]|uniref:Uncharacterized protein n=1 Tax=Thermosulfidibacter takaii (strain DSM 17441 / JCM 13301 / NBRC 103674 / ABI70S6) TaxID=1298851 RepID=A0A0S3QST8_THET7|nr:hypothetical protein [Thermosulfidibacter takaii]BAT71406.1 hypothetical protein TST_0600 [Thermosulfidibacter takaii ABI70S6]
MNVNAQPIATVPYGGGLVPQVSNVKEAADAFESLLWQSVLKESFKTVGDDNSLFSGKGEKGIYLQLILWRLSDYLSKTMDTDIGREIYKKFSKGYRKPSPHPIYNNKKNGWGGVP